MAVINYKKNDGTVKSIEQINVVKNVNITEVDIFKISYPVGSYYWSSTDQSPIDLYGSDVGTWEQIKDTFILAAGDVYQEGSIGGEATHVLTKDEIPSHNHTNGNYASVDGQDGSPIAFNGTAAGGASCYLVNMTRNGGADISSFFNSKN